MRHEGCASLGLWAFALVGGAAAAARAAPLQLQGELTITNRTNELEPSDSLFNLPGGRQFTLSVFGDPPGIDPSVLLGETTLTSVFWPDPGLTFTGPIAVDFMSPGTGLVEVQPIRVDGLVLSLLLSAGLPFRGPPMTGGGTPDAFGAPLPIEIIRRSRIGQGTPTGTGLLRVDAVVPEPSTGVILFLGVAGAVSLLSRQKCLLETRRKEILP